MWVRTALLTSLIYSSVIFPVGGLTHNIKNTSWVLGFEFQMQKCADCINTSGLMYNILQIFNYTVKIAVRHHVFSKNPHSDETQEMLTNQREAYVRFNLTHLLWFVSTCRLKCGTTPCLTWYLCTFSTSVVTPGVKQVPNRFYILYSLDWSCNMWLVSLCVLHFEGVSAGFINSNWLLPFTFFNFRF